MRTIFTIIFFAIIQFSVFAQMTINGSIMHDGLKRTYVLRLPANANPNNPVPLVFNFHGFGSNAEQQQLYSNMNAVADREKFAVCYPEGINAAWNVGWAFGSQAKDLEMVVALIDSLSTKYGFDQKRIYACGMSNGGFFSFKLACELNDKIAAIASVTGSMVPTELPKCNPGKPVPVMQIHGTADGTVAYGGSAIGSPIEDVLKFWQENNGCDAAPTKTLVPNTVSFDNTTSELYVYNNCDENADVIHYKVLNGAHTWPGAFIALGTTSQDFNASEEIWKFFKRYNIDGLVSSTDIVNDQSFVSINPNPFLEEISIEVTQKVNIEIRNINGQLIYKGIGIEGSNKVNLSHVKPWTYIVSIRSNKISNTFKLIKI
jgi:polyhydroxybutyrate depolymerase